VVYDCREHFCQKFPGFAHFGGVGFEIQDEMDEVGNTRPSPKVCWILVRPLTPAAEASERIVWCRHIRFLQQLAHLVGNEKLTRRSVGFG
jgi:hypothetical protein